MKTSRSLSLDDLELLESVCARFENAKSTEDCDFDSLLTSVPESVREYFIYELVALDIELRQRQGQTLSVNDYSSIANESDAKIAAKAFEELSNDQSEKFDELLRGSLPKLPDRYQQLNEVGRGGIGTVWRVQDQHTQRTLAIKMLRDKFRFDRQANIRLEREALLTASLQHPGIPPVHDYGKLSDESSFFVMKLVDGQTLDEILQQGEGQERLSQCLAIFEQVAQSLAYVHTQGVIHRDLKPQNIMVGRFGEVQLMDWGMAKRLNSPVVNGNPSREKPDKYPATETISRSRDSSIEFEAGITRAGDVLGTPSYMAPEQARGEIHKIDTRTDVFGLGAILFEILTGSRLYEHESAAEVIKKVADGDFENILSKLEKSQAAPVLENLCKQCLALDPDDRPGNASEVADVITQYFANTQEQIKEVAVELRAAEVRVDEEAKRRKSQLRMMGAILGMLVLGLAGVSWQWSLAKKAKNNSDGVLQIVADSFQSVSPDRGGDAKMTAREVLINAKESMEDSKLDDDGKILLISKLTSCFLSIGEWEEAVAVGEKGFKLAESQFGNDNHETLILARQVGTGYYRTNRLGEANTLLKETIERLKVTVGEDHEEMFAAKNALISTYFRQGKYPKAISEGQIVFEDAKRILGTDHQRTYELGQNLIGAYMADNDGQKAVDISNEILPVMRETLGDDHPQTLGVIGNTGLAYFVLEQFDKSIENSEEVIEVMEHKLGADHPDRLFMMVNLASTYAKVNRLDDAIKLHQEALPMLEAKMGVNHPAVLTCRAQLAFAFKQSGRLDERLALLEESVPVMEKNMDQAHPTLLTVRDTLVQALRDAGRIRECIEMAQKNFEVCEKLKGIEHADTKNYLNRFVWTIVSSEFGDDQITDSLVAKYREFSAASQSSANLTMLAVLEYRKGNMEQAIDAAEKSLEPDEQSDLEKIALLAICHSRSGNEIKATEYLTQFKDSLTEEALTENPRLAYWIDNVESEFELSNEELTGK